MKSRGASIGKSAGRAQPVGGDQKIHIFYFLVCGASSHKGVFLFVCFFFPAAWYDLPTRPLRQWDFTNPRCRTGPSFSREETDFHAALFPNLPSHPGIEKKSCGHKRLTAWLPSCARAARKNKTRKSTSPPCGELQPHMNVH